MTASNDRERAADLLNHDFRADTPKRIWVTDFTYVLVYAGFVYVALAIVLHPGRAWGGDPHGQGHRVRGTML